MTLPKTLRQYFLARIPKEDQRLGPRHTKCLLVPEACDMYV